MYTPKITGQTHKLNVAGKNENSVAGLLRYYSEEELAEYLLRAESQKQIMEARTNLVPRISGTSTTEMGTLLSPELEKTRFVQFREQFSENMYFPKSKVGQIMPTFSKPSDVTNISKTFGIRTQSGNTLYDIVLPKRSVSEVNREFYAFHNKKLISHRHFLPSERINRHYNSPPYDANKTYGLLFDVNKEGVRIKRAMQEEEATAVISAVQNKFMERTQSTLGKKLKRLCANVSEDMILGLPTPLSPCDAKAVIENINPCIKNKQLFEAVMHLNKIRRRLFKRSDLHINELRFELQRNDVLRIGYLPLAAIVEVANKFHMRIETDKLQVVLKHFEIVKDEGKPTECVDYEAFCRLLQVEYPLPVIPKPVVTEHMFSKHTTYRDMCSDLLAKKKVASSDEGNAADLRYKAIRENIIKAKRTTAKDVVSPNIPTRFGLNPADFEVPRSKQDLRRVFSRVLSDDAFHEAWTQLNEAVKDPYEFYTVNEMRKAAQLSTDTEDEQDKKLKRLQAADIKPVKDTKILEKELPTVQTVVEQTPELEPNQIDEKAGGDVLDMKEKKVRFSI